MSCVAMTCVGAVGCAGGLVALKRQGKSFSRPVVARANASGQSSGVELKDSHGSKGVELNRRSVLEGSARMLGLWGAGSALGSEAWLGAMAAGLKGFETVKDQQDGYQFAYPFGWQEVSVKGQDVVYKDVIEPLESVSVSYIPTDKTSIEEYGDVNEVTSTLVTKVLTTPGQNVKLINCEIRDANGRKYYDFEYTAANPRYSRHAMASVTVGNGKFYTLETGANEKRWSKIGGKVKTVVKSFEVFDRTDY